MSSIIDYPDIGKYNIKSVSKKTGIQPVTMRAWERRYSVLTPKRAENGYRLYSERDMALLVWLKTQVDSGVSISSAVNELRINSSRGIWPEAVLNNRSPVPSRTSHLPPQEYSKKLFDSLTTHDEETGTAIFEEALASFELTDLFESVLIPMLIEVGEAWYNGHIKVSTEHFASGFMRARLLSIFQALPIRRNSPSILIGSGPDELHEIGPMMLAILLRNAGLQVEYLGPDIPLEDLVDYADSVNPRMIILSATLKESARDLQGFQSKLMKLSRPPLFGYGGSAFLFSPELIEKTPGTFLGKTLSQAVLSVQSLLTPGKKEPLAV